MQDGFFDLKKIANLLKLKGLFLGLSERDKLTILSLVVGIASGFAAVILEKLIFFFQQSLDFDAPGFLGSFRYLIYPGIGMLLSYLIVRYLIKDNIGHGVTKVLLAVSRNESRIKPHNTYSSVLTSSLTIGFGGSVGAEAPIVYTGAAIGSNVARLAGMSYRSMTTLLGCGAAAAIAGIFKAPLAGVLFTLEVLLFNISMTSMMPLLLSTVSATVVSYLFLGQSHPFQCTLTPFAMVNIPFYVILGIICGLCAVYFLRTTLGLEDRMANTHNPYRRWLLCSLGLGLMIFFFPPLFGEGYDFISILLNGHPLALENDTPLAFMLRSPWGVVVFFLAVLLLKVFSMTLTNTGGGVGGTFGPTLFVGAITGFVVARALNLILTSSGFDFNVPEQNFVLVGMAGLMAGVMQAPMTAIFLIAEISGGYELFLPLILTSAISFGVTRFFETYSIYTKRIAQSGDLITHDSDQSALTLLKTADLVRDKYPKVSMEDSLGELAKTISTTPASVVAVLDGEGRFKGLVNVDVAEVRNMLFDTERYDTLKVRNVMEQPAAMVSLDEKMESVMAKFDRTGAWRLPVMDKDGKYQGFISKSRILLAYRDEIKELFQD